MAPRDKNRKRKTGRPDRQSKAGSNFKPAAAEERHIKARLKLLNLRLQLINKLSLSLTTGCEQAARARRALSDNAGAETFRRALGKLRQ